MKISNVPSVLAFDRKLEPSDALMFSGCWRDTDDNKKWSPVELFERRNRAVKSNFKQEILDDEEELQKQITEANLSWGDDAALNHNHDTLKVSFSLRVIAGIAKPSVCNDTNFEDRYRERISSYVQTGLNELANRYAYNIANGRFLWRNRVGALAAKIVVSHSSLAEPLEFNAYDFPLHQTTSDNPKQATLANLIHKGLSGTGLSGTENILLKISAFVQLGDGQRVWPSQEMVLNSPKGSKSRHLFNINGQAAIHCEKIGNALRTIDDWYPNATSPIAVEAYGTVTQRGIAYRSSRNDFKTLLLAWLKEETDNDEKMTESKHFVAAMLIRGGVFGESVSDSENEGVKMKYYIELQLLPDAEISLDFLWQKVFQQVHIALVDNKIGQNKSAIALSFPNYNAGIGGEHAFPLGNQLRLLANEETQLTNLNIKQWLSRFDDYVHIKSIKPVPETMRHVAFVREQVKGEARIEKDMQSKAKRWAEKSGQSLETCLAELEKTKPKADNSLPFIWLESQETKQRNAQESRKFPLFIKMVALTKEQAGVFNCYGLNANSSNEDKLTSVPQF